MKQYEKKITSQFGEDGIIEHIFNNLGTTNKIAVEIGVGDYQENNTYNLLNNEWKVYWFDIVQNKVTHNNLNFTKISVNTDNVVDLLEQRNIPIEFDLLSIDIDGNDYHVRKAISKYKPRVIVMEYNGAYAASTEYIMPHNNSYKWRGSPDIIFNASLKSLQLLNNSLGYDLIYCTSQGVNAFFVRKDINCFEAKQSEDVYKQLFWYYGKPL